MTATPLVVIVSSHDSSVTMASPRQIAFFQMRNACGPSEKMTATPLVVIACLQQSFSHRVFGCAWTQDQD